MSRRVSVELAADMSGLAHAGDNHAAVALQQGVAGDGEGLCQSLQQGIYRIAFHADGARGGCNIVKIGHVLFVGNR